MMTATGEAVSAVGIALTLKVAVKARAVVEMIQAAAVLVPARPGPAAGMTTSAKHPGWSNRDIGPGLRKVVAVMVVAVLL